MHASAALTPMQVKCQDAIAEASLRFLAGMVKIDQQCRDANLRWAHACSLPPDLSPVGKLIARLRARLVDALHASLDDHCDIGPANLRQIGFPGFCNDRDPADGFTLVDLEACIESATDNAIHGSCTGGSNAGESCDAIRDCPDSGPGASCAGLLSAEYDDSLAVPLPAASRGCQTALAHASSKFLVRSLKAIHQCRRDLHDCRVDDVGVATCKIVGVLPSACATDDPTTAAAIAKARDSARARIEGKCDDAIVNMLKACEPDQTTASGAASCELASHQAFAARFLAIEFPALRMPPSCGNGVVDTSSEECDGDDDAACPGQCGVANGFFPCLCQGVSQQARQRVIEHDADLEPSRPARKQRH